MVGKFRKKPIVIEAVQWTGENKDVINNFIGLTNTPKTAKLAYGESGVTLLIKTLEGVMEAIPNDWIIKGVNGEFYPYKPDIFEKTYEIVNN